MDNITPEKIKEVSKKTEELLKKTKQEMIDELKKQPCSWPNCGKPMNMMVNVVTLVKHNATIEQVKGKVVPTTLCNFHAFIAHTGMLGALQTDDPKRFTMQGPIEEVNIAEITITAMLMTGRVEEILQVKKSMEEASKASAQKVTEEVKVDTQK